MLREIYNPIILAIREAPKPVIAAVNGAAAGIGCSLALACDLVVAAESAYFLLAFVRIGLGPDGGSTTHLMQRIGPARTAELMMLGERLPARQALDWGLINAVHPDAALTAEAFALAARLATGPTVAIATAKTLLREAPLTPLADQLAREASLQQTHARTTDYVEGVTAFREKRPARFTGR
jgi:2-(1,2-epoxy-1,2-dihydrophenyl)acetyl-CoA isomerase